METNVRVVKKTKTGGYTTLTKAQSGIKELCEFCSFESCKIRKQLKRVGGRISITLTECMDYQFPLVFRDISGTDGLFNTFRLGSAWSKRLVTGNKVGLVDGDLKVFGTASVTSVMLLDRKEALSRHSYRNHLMLDKNRFKASELLSKVLRNNYGKLVYNNCEVISVIYLSRDT